MERDLRTLMWRDHECLEEAFDALVDSLCDASTAARTTAWEAFVSRVRMHFELEEELVFPAFARVAPDEVVALRRAHDALRKDIALIEGGIAACNVPEGIVRGLTANLHLHAAREDAFLHRWIETEFPVKQRKELHARLAAAMPE